MVAKMQALMIIRATTPLTEPMTIIATAGSAIVNPEYLSFHAFLDDHPNEGQVSCDVQAER